MRRRPGRLAQCRTSRYLNFNQTTKESMEKHRHFTVQLRIDGSLMRKGGSEYHTVTAMRWRELGAGAAIVHDSESTRDSLQ